MTETTTTRKRSFFNRPGRVVLAAGIVVTGLLAGGWLAYAMPNQPSTRPVLTDTGATPTPASTPPTTSTPEPTVAPTVAPTAHPSVAPTVVPNVRPTPQPQTSFTIPVPVIRQTMVLDCETAALQMGLGGPGVRLGDRRQEPERGGSVAASEGGADPGVQRRLGAARADVMQSE